jgi:hypothetical protein
VRVALLRHAIITLSLVASMPLIVSCLDSGAKCASSTAKFPISGTVVQKDNSGGRNCYMLHVRRSDNLNTEIVRVSRYRYKNTNLHNTVSYSSQPTD